MKTAKEIAMLLAERAEEAARHLLPNGKRAGNEFCVGSINGEAGQSLKVKISGDKTGVFCDFSTHESGDLLGISAPFNAV